MKLANLTDDEVKQLGEAYRSLVDWIHANAIDGESTMSMLFKAAMVIAVTNNIPKDEVMGVASAVFDMEKFFHPSAEEIH